MIVDGTRKKQVCDWWLTYVEEVGDEFLKRLGYDAEGLPGNYMEVRRC
jgi:hypothetical protein